MGQKNSGEKGVSRREFFRIASAAGFGTIAGAFLFSIPGYDFGDDQDSSGHSLGVLYRIKEADLAEEKSYSISEIIMEPGSETFVMYNKESHATYEGISGQAIILSSQESPSRGKATVQKGVKVTMKPGKHFQLVNPSKKRVNVLQKYAPVWKPDKSFIKVGDKTIQGSELWFELRETLVRQKTGLKYRLIQTSNKGALLDVRVDPGVKSAVEYHKKCLHTITVSQGSGIVSINGKNQKAGPRDKIILKPGTKFQLINPSSDLWEVQLQSKPGWRPNDSFYLAGDKEIPGADVWFGIRLG